eukprot:2178311-Pyramimonas_sp.AAC.1
MQTEESTIGGHLIDGVILFVKGNSSGKAIALLKGRVLCAERTTSHTIAVSAAKTCTDSKLDFPDALRRRERGPARGRESVEFTPHFMAAGFPGNPSCQSGRPDHPPVRAG